MALTMQEQKDKYYKLVLEKANAIYSAWEINGITSKRLVAKANEYAFDNRLKTDALHRFYTLAFTVALGLRLEKRYGTFLRRLFHFFAYIREKKALKILKRVFGFADYTDIREWIGIETEKIIVLLSRKQNQQSTGGGKRAEMEDITLEETLNAFLEDCLREDEQKTSENDLDSDNIEKSDDRDKSLFVETEDLQREKISVEELRNGERMDEQKSSTRSWRTERREKETTATIETGNEENKNTEKTVEKTIASTSILAEITEVVQERKQDVTSPFPVFREPHEGKTATVEREDIISSKDSHETKLERENGENFSKDIHVENERKKIPFPVFRSDKIETVKISEKMEQKEIKETKQIKEIKGTKEIIEIEEIKGVDEKVVHAQREISEENKTRIALNTTMSKEQINAIVEQLKTAANIEMEKDERAWNEMKVSMKDNATLSDKSVIAIVPKK